MDHITLSVERLQTFLDGFYNNLNSRRRYYRYHDGNKAKTIESIELKQCNIVKEKENYKEDVLIVKYTTEDNIVCAFSILLGKLKDYDLMSESLCRKTLRI
jgi:hypothetical protein